MREALPGRRIRTQYRIDCLTYGDKYKTGQAQSIDPSVTRPTIQRSLRLDAGGSVFRYIDTASSRAGIGAITEKLKVRKAVAIAPMRTVPASAILDLVARTPAAEIQLFDGDQFGQHNASRSAMATRPLKR